MSTLKRVLIGAVALAGIGAFAVIGAVGYASVAADDRLRYPDTPIPDIEASTDPDIIARGRYIVTGPGHCGMCHSVSDRDDFAKIGRAPLSGGLPFELGPLGARYAANLTPDAETGIGRWTDGEIARAIRTGVTPTGDLSIFMKLSIGRFADEDLVAIVSYLRSLEPVHNPVPEGYFTLFGKTLVTFAFPDLPPRDAPVPSRVPAGEQPSASRGEYVTTMAHCLECHRELDMNTFAPVGPPGGGSLPEPSHGADHDMEFVAPNLTSHPTGISGKLSEDAFVARLGAGRVFASSVMPWEAYGQMTEADMRSIYRYLKSLPPIDNDVGPTYRKQGWTP